jgi:hypothetical protein
MHTIIEAVAFGKTINRRLRPHKPPDLNMCHYYMWQTQKYRAYITSLGPLPEVKSNVVFEKKLILFRDNNDDLRRDICSESTNHD